MGTLLVLVMRYCLLVIFTRTLAGIFNQPKIRLVPFGTLCRKMLVLVQWSIMPRLCVLKLPAWSSFMGAWVVIPSGRVRIELHFALTTKTLFPWL